MFNESPEIGIILSEKDKKKLELLDMAYSESKTSEEHVCLMAEILQY